MQEMAPNMTTIRNIKTGHILSKFSDQTWSFIKHDNTDNKVLSSLMKDQVWSENSLSIYDLF
jgi:hypothetical protein